MPSIYLWLDRLPKYPRCHERKAAKRLKLHWLLWLPSWLTDWPPVCAKSPHKHLAKLAPIQPRPRTNMPQTGLAKLAPDKLAPNRFRQTRPSRFFIEKCKLFFWSYMKFIVRAIWQQKVRFCGASLNFVVMWIPLETLKGVKPCSRGFKGELGKLPQRRIGETVSKASWAKCELGKLLQRRVGETASKASSSKGELGKLL